MIGYVTLGTNNLERAAAFYDALIAEIGGKRAWSSDRGIGWSAGKGPSLAAMKPFDGKPATTGNGTMVSLLMPDRATVDRMHAKALALGGADEGAPGLRGDTFYGAYCRDLDGNKLCFFARG